MSDKLQRIEAAFGKPLPEALFYHFDYALRFELSIDGTSWPDRILGACDRARAILAALPTPETEWDIIIVNYDERPEFRIGYFDADTLDIYGCAGSEVTEIGEDHIDGAFHRAYLQIEPPPTVSACLFGVLSSDCPSLVLPFPGSVYLVDWERGIVAHPYDDRGMDLIALKPEVLAPIYRQFNHWLLDFDRARMDSVFAPPS